MSGVKTKRLDKVIFFAYLFCMFPIIEKLGGWDGVSRIMNRRGDPVTDLTIEKWRQRGLPARVKFMLAIEANKRRIPFTERDFVGIVKRMA